MMRTYNLLGVVEHKSDRLAEARAWYQKSRQLAEELQDQPGLGNAAQNIGIIFLVEGKAARAQGDENAAKLKFSDALISVQESLRIAQALGNQPDEAGSFNEIASIYLCLGDLAAAEHNAHEAREIFESLGLKDAAKTYGVLSKIAVARGDSAAAAAWTQQRDAKRAELQRRAGGGLSGEMIQALQALTRLCAQAGFNDQPLAPEAKAALTTLDGYPAPFPEFSAALRQLAAGQVPAVPATLPAELQQLLFWSVPQ